MTTDTKPDQAQEHNMGLEYIQARRTDHGAAAEECGRKYENSEWNKFQIASLAFLDGAAWGMDRIIKQHELQKMVDDECKERCVE